PARERPPVPPPLHERLALAVHPLRGDLGGVDLACPLHGLTALSLCLHTTPPPDCGSLRIFRPPAGGADPLALVPRQPTRCERSCPVEDREILQRINDLMDEEPRLLNEHHQGNLGEDEQQRMHALEVTLDQCWDLLRQRRARRHAGLDPNEAAVRPESVVENYRH